MTTTKSQAAINQGVSGTNNLANARKTDRYTANLSASMIDLWSEECCPQRDRLNSYLKEKHKDKFRISINGGEPRVLRYISVRACRKAKTIEFHGKPTHSQSKLVQYKSILKAKEALDAQS